MKSAKYRSLILAGAVLLSTGISTSSASAQEQEQAPSTDAETPCLEYFDANPRDGYDMTCFGDVLSYSKSPTAEGVVGPDLERLLVSEDGVSAVPMTEAEIAERTVVPQDDSAPGVAARARVDDYRSNTFWEKIYFNYSGGPKGQVSNSIKLNLRNHSADVTMGWTEISNPPIPIELEWELSIREDRALITDLEVFDYENPDNYRTGPTTYSTLYEPYSGVGFDALPYPAQASQYFWSMHELKLQADGYTQLSVIGDFQSDRATCVAGEPCRFIEGDT